jgi:hypothetical protein
VARFDGLTGLKNKRTESIRAVKYGQKVPLLSMGKNLTVMPAAMGL